MQPVKTDERGAFTFERLPPGASVFGVNVTKDRWKPTIGRPTSDPKKSAVMEPKPGDRRNVGVLRLLIR
jgi:hypothetical protein